MTDHHTAPLTAVLERVERVEALDQIVERAEEVLSRIPEATRRALKGTDWVGHPLHPALVHLPLGSWMAASVMDAAGKPDTARSLTVLGVAAALPAVVAGWLDWADLGREHKRVGVVHAAANSLGLALYTASVVARCSGRARLGRKLGLAGLIAVSAGAAVGGDLAYHSVELSEG
jgi:uncharacterized membrane protein